MTLFIDTTQCDLFRLAFITESRVFDKNYASQARFSEKIPSILQKELQKHNFLLKDIKKIVVVSGPGSFVGTRTGVSFANSLAWGLDIPVVGLSVENVPENLSQLLKIKAKKQPAAAIYAAPPNITQAKK